jgi:endonuclease/exonuclease/phosphatase family metal-dependent hydrolase
MVQGVFASIRLDRLARRTALAVAAFVAAPAMLAAQTTVTLDALHTEINCDLTIQGGGYAGVNFQSSDGLALKNSDANYTRRVLLKFDTQNKIPAGAHITSAKLRLVLKDGGNGGGRPITAYRVSKSFHLDQATWVRYDDNGRWTRAGGDLADKYTTTTVGNAVGSAYTFDLTKAVQDSVSGKFGSRYTRLALVDTGAKSSTSYREFFSSRAANPAVRPKLVITYGGTSGGGTSGGGGTPEPVASGSGGSGSATIKVMQWNIHKTKGTDGRCNPDRTASWIVRLGAQVVSLNEVDYFSGSCSWTADMSARLEALVEQKSGRPWYRRFGNGGGNGVGNVILSSLPFASSEAHSLPYDRTAIRAAVVVNGRTINIFGTHVDYDHPAWRTTQTNQVKAWASSFAEPRIVMGDFNTGPSTNDYKIMASAYADSWVAGQQAGVANAYKSGGTTHGASRFDYVYHTKASPIVLKSVTVPDTKTNGVYPSDHDPVVAVYEVR